MNCRRPVESPHPSTEGPSLTKGARDVSSDTQDRTPSRDTDSKRHDASTNGRPSSLTLALLGAVGFGAAFSMVCAIDATRLDIIKNTFADIFPGTAVGPQGGFIPAPSLAR